MILLRKKITFFAPYFIPLCVFFGKPVLLPKHCVVPMYCVYTLHGLNKVVFKPTIPHAIFKGLVYALINILRGTGWSQDEGLNMSS